MKTVAFVPIKLNNERFPGKNVKRFTNGKPLINCIVDTMLQVSQIDEFYVYCSSDEIADYLPENVVLLKRSQSLDLPTASITDVISAFCDAVPSDIYILLHATAPFVSFNTLSSCIHAVQSGQHDSAFPVRRMNDFLWINGTPNYNLASIPRTQDLPPVFAETSGFYVFTRDVVGKRRRIGDKPYFYEVSQIEATDIDYPEDFEIADVIYTHILRKKGTP